MRQVIKKGKFSLREILIFSLISQVVVAVGLTSYFSWRNGRKTVEELALRLSREVTNHTQKHIGDYLNTPTTFLEVNRTLADTGHFDIESQQELQTIFWQQAQINPEINTIYYGSETGDFVEIEFKNHPKVMIRNQDTAPYWHLYGLDQKGQKTALLSTKEYDPRERPWYKAAKIHKDLVWSPIYLFADPPVLGITPAVPLKDSTNQQLKGVMAIDLTLSDISTFLRGLKIGDSGKTFIVDQSGKMVATSTNNPIIKKTTHGNERLHYLESADPLVKATANFLEQKSHYFRNPDALKQHIFQYEDKRHFIQAKKIDDYPGLNWLIVTVIPESDFNIYMRRNTQTTLLLSALSLISALILGVIANRWIVKSVNYISDVAKAISEKRINIIERQPNIKELATVTQSLNQMAFQLEVSAQDIKNIESRWERRVEETAKNFQIVNQELNRLANIDALTQIHNRYHFDLALQQEWGEALKNRDQLALLLLDVDNFKLYNDTYGHLKGDECLRKIAQTIQNNISRNQDIAARYGGEEFAVILPHTNIQGAVGVAERIRQAVSNLGIPHQDSDAANYVTVSCGIASLFPKPGIIAVQLIDKADIALYQAKKQGKNCWTIADMNNY